MSAFGSIALPGGIPTFGGGKSAATPEALFGSSAEKAAYRRILDGASCDGEPFKVKGVHVRIFDLSDKEQVGEYERLWASLLSKISKGTAVVDHHNDLVRRADGTSYWMKYVEYVEFGDDDCNESAKDSGGDSK